MATASYGVTWTDERRYITYTCPGGRRVCDNRLHENKFLKENMDYIALLLQIPMHYDYIIVDTPPLGMVIDAAVIAAKCDSAALVIGKKDVKYRQAQEVVEQLKKSGCKVLGVVLNNSTSKHGKYYYSRSKYGYYYAGHQSGKDNAQQDKT